jgi:hypothetical protein
MPIPDPDKIWPKLDELGVDEVRKRLSMGVYAKYKIPVINEWLRRKEKKENSSAKITADVLRRDAMGGLNPKAFVSYSWDDDNHKKWVAQLATRLRSDTVEVILDQWYAVPGDQLPEFMEREIRKNDYVLIICTPNYKQKSDNRSGGVGYEGDIMTAEIFSKGNHRKFIPILARGTWADASPSWLKGKYFIDLSSDHLLKHGEPGLTTPSKFLESLQMRLQSLD